jgi:succinate dehydrogenase/fumarate reductase flavoprotein subunit
VGSHTEADVIVVGGGAAGLAASSEAARAGRSVILLEKGPRTGGMMSWSVGTVTATNTPHQHRAGITDTPQAHFEDLALHAGPLAPRDNLALRRILVDHGNEMFEWLLARGLVFLGPNPDPPHRVPRMHNIVPNAAAFAYQLTRYCRSLGVDIQVDTSAVRLLVEGERVVGVEARTAEGHVRQLRARCAVVLASGDYSAAADLKVRFGSPALGEVEPVVKTCTGDGYRLAFEVGATMLNGDLMRGPIMRFVPPSRPKLVQKLPPARPVALAIAWAMDHLPQWILRPFLMSFLTTVLGPSPELFRHGAILVNGRGERFTDELRNAAADVAKQDGGAYIVFDGAVAARFSAWPHFVSTAPGIGYAYIADYRRNRRDIFHEAGTVEALARSLGAPADALRATLDAYNTASKEGPRISRPPFYALGPVRSYVSFTEGGLKVTERLEVVREDGAAIPGLYAAGAVGQGGLLLEGHGHHLAWSFISGRIAGRNAAFERAGTRA